MLCVKDVGQHVYYFSLFGQIEYVNEQKQLVVVTFYWKSRIRTLKVKAAHLKKAIDHHVLNEADLRMLQIVAIERQDYFWVQALQRQIENLRN